MGEEHVKDKQATLPEKYILKAIADMKDGERGYTVPWAMVVGKDMKLWLDTSYSVSASPSPSGTAKLEIGKVSGSYWCDISMCQDSGWDVEDVYERDNYVPVRKLIGA